jgi:hypothetical protein
MLVSEGEMVMRAKSSEGKPYEPGVLITRGEEGKPKIE